MFWVRVADERRGFNTGVCGVRGLVHRSASGYQNQRILKLSVAFLLEKPAFSRPNYLSLFSGPEYLQVNQTHRSATTPLRSEPMHASGSRRPAEADARSLRGWKGLSWSLPFFTQDMGLQHPNIKGSTSLSKNCMQLCAMASKHIILHVRLLTEETSRQTSRMRQRQLSGETGRDGRVLDFVPPVTI